MNPDSRGSALTEQLNTLFSHATPPATKAALLDLTSSRFVFYGMMRQLLLGLAGTVLLLSTQSIINSRISSPER